MSKTKFDRNSMAERYARRHLKTDPGIKAIYYLPSDAPRREIRFVEINALMASREKDPIEPIDFGVDTGTETAHRLKVVDVTPSQWERIKAGELPLPKGWSLAGASSFTSS
jgi:hypothetical protein